MIEFYRLRLRIEERSILIAYVKTWWDVYKQTESIDASSIAARKLMMHFGTIQKAREFLQREGVIR
jgi:hypothetical protein